MIERDLHRNRKNIFVLLMMGIATYMVYSDSHMKNTLVKLSGYASAVNRKIFIYWDDADKNMTLPELFSVVPISSTNVFLIWPFENPSILYRHMCSAESWALHHPDSSIWYTFTVSEIEDPGDSAKKLLQIYPNIKFIYSDVDKLTKDTPLYKLIKSKAWKAAPYAWQGSQMADFFRHSVLWHKGGYYSDTDLFAVRNMLNKRNFISTSTGHVDPALMRFDNHHPYTMAVMETFAKTYDPNDYLTDPHATITAMVNKCGKMYGKDIGKQERNCTLDGRITTFLPETCSPYPCVNAFIPKKTSIYDQYLQNGAMVINICNGLSRHAPARFGTDCILDKIAKINCPFTYSQAQKHSNFW